MAKKVSYNTNIRIVELDGNFQPQIFTWVKVKFWQPIKREWEPLVYGDKYWYDTIEEAESIIDMRINPAKELKQIIHYYG